MAEQCQGKVQESGSTVEGNKVCIEVGETISDHSLPDMWAILETEPRSKYPFWYGTWR